MLPDRSPPRPQRASPDPNGRQKSTSVAASAASSSLGTRLSARSTPARQARSSRSPRGCGRGPRARALRRRARGARSGYRVAEREELTETGLGSTARCRGRRRHRQANSVRVCSPTSRRVASLRPRSAGLTALTPAPRTLVQTGSCRRCSLIHPLHVVVDVPSRMTLFRATADIPTRFVQKYTVRTRPEPPVLSHFVALDRAPDRLRGPERQYLAGDQQGRKTSWGSETGTIILSGTTLVSA